MVTAFVKPPLNTPLPAASDDPQLEWVRSSLLNFARSLPQARTPRELRRRLEVLAPKYMFLKWGMFRRLEEEATAHGGWSELVRDTHSELFQILNTSGADIFSPTDRRILLEVLRGNARLVDLCNQIPTENAPSLYSAIMDGFAALQKLDLSITTIVLVASKEVATENTRLLHWLCLAARSYLREFETALFINSPILRNRLTQEPRTISSKEMERRLGLSS